MRDHYLQLLRDHGCHDAFVELLGDLPDDVPLFAQQSTGRGSYFRVMAGPGRPGAVYISRTDMHMALNPRDARRVMDETGAAAEVKNLVTWRVKIRQDHVRDPARRACLLQAVQTSIERSVDRRGEPAGVTATGGNEPVIRAEVPPTRPVQPASGWAAVVPLAAREPLTLADVARPFATSLREKSLLLQLPLTKRQRSRVNESLSDDLKKYCDVIFPDFQQSEVSVAAYEAAMLLGVDLCQQAWHQQARFDKGRAVFHLEHTVPICVLRALCVEAADADQVVEVLTTQVRTAWILKSEDRELTRLGFTSKRPDPDRAYRQAGIVLMTCHAQAG